MGHPWTCGLVGKFQTLRGQQQIDELTRQIVFLCTADQLAQIVCVCRVFGLLDQSM